MSLCSDQVYSQRTPGHHIQSFLSEVDPDATTIEDYLGA